VARRPGAARAGSRGGGRDALRLSLTARRVPDGPARPPARGPALEATHKDLRRIARLWNALLTRFGGPWLVGPEWSIADAFFTPVATRLRTYGVRLSDFGDSGLGGAYAERLLEAPEYLAWEAGAK